jgi:PAS domain S-box-containing protein
MFQSFNIFAILLSFIPAIINIGLFIYSFYFLKKDKLVSVFSFLVLTCAIWQISDSLTRIVNDIETVELIYRVLSFGVNFLLPTGVHFSLLYTDRLKKNNSHLILTILYLPSILICLSYLFGFSEGYFIPDNFWNYLYVPVGFVDNAASMWLSILALSTMIILITYCIKVKNEESNKYKGAFLLTFGFSIPAIIGIITAVILPFFYKIEEVPLTTTFITIFSISSIYSLNKFKFNLFAFNPFLITEQIFDSISEGIFITDKDGIIKYINKSFYKHFGYTESEIINTPKIEILVDKEKNLNFNDYLLNYEKIINHNIEQQIYHKNGEKKDILINRQPFYNQKKEVIGIVSLMLDITILKEKEHELQKTQQQLLLSQKIAGIGLMSYNLKSGNVNLSEVSKNIYGIDNKLNTINLDLLRSFRHPDDVEIIEDALKQAIQSKKQFNIEYRIINQKSKEIVWIKAQAELYYDEKEVPTELVGTIMDITKSKNYERDYLTAMLKGEETEKTRIAQELHDGIAQYLAAINMNLIGIKDNIPEEISEHYSNIQKLVAQTIIETRSISHNLIPKAMDFGLEIALNHLSDRYKDKGTFKIKINFNKINEDEIQQFTRFNLYRISQEFINNTYKYAKAKNVSIEFSSNKDKLHFTLQDDGVGFELNEESENGIGIKNITQRVKAISGALNIISKHNQGTRFEIIFSK